MKILALFTVALFTNLTFAADLRIASWNMINRPNNQSQDATLATIAEAMGRIDILSLSETDAHSATRAAEVFNDVFPLANYEVAFTKSHLGGERTGFLFDTTTVSLLSLAELTEGLSHPMLRGDFQFEDFQLNFYSIQLQPGGLLLDSETRANDAEILRTNAKSLPADSHIIYGGDFNWRTSSEPAWDVFTRSGPGQGFDAYDVFENAGVGDWRGNEAFKHLHTQDPRPDTSDGETRLDDRFDMQLVSDAFFDDRGLEIVPGSYRVFGNNGTHELNRSILTGTGASPEVLSALANFSHHLPVITDFRILLPGDLNKDDEVAFADFLILSRNFGSTQATATEGDINGDNLVDFADFLLLSGNFGRVKQTREPTEAVPEPRSTHWIVIALLLLIRFQRTMCDKLDRTS